jgi:mRNA interferase RelE/StbE
MIERDEQHAAGDGNYEGPVLPLWAYRNLLKEVEDIGATHFYDRVKAFGEKAIPFRRAIEKIDYVRPDARGKYDIIIQDRVHQRLGLLPVAVYDVIKNAILELRENPNTSSQKLKERDGWRVDVKDYVVIFEIDDPQKIITILHIGHRDEVYRLPVPDDSGESEQNFLQ